MARKVLSLVNSRLKFLYQKQNFLTLPLCRLLCIVLIQPHYDYACPVRYPSLNKRLSKKIQTSQNRCIRYCLNLDNRAHVKSCTMHKHHYFKFFKKCLCNPCQKFFTHLTPDVTHVWQHLRFKRLLKKIQTSQNRCIRYCLNLDNRAHVKSCTMHKHHYFKFFKECLRNPCQKFFTHLTPDVIHVWQHLN